MDERELTLQLTRLGLTSYEARAYLTLIRRETFSAGEVARQSGLPRQRIYDVLGSLVQRGLAVARPGAVVRYVALPPDQAVELLLDARRAELVALEDEGARLVEATRPAFEAGRDQLLEPGIVEVIMERRAIGARLDELRAGATREILAVTHELPAEPPASGVATRWILVTEARADEAAMAWLATAGHELRFVAGLPIEMLIVDGSTVALVSADGAADGERTLLVIEQRALAGVLRMAFDAYWADGVAAQDVLSA